VTLRPYFEEEKEEDTPDRRCGDENDDEEKVSRISPPSWTQFQQQ